jgi:hypothetical protein
LVAEGKGTDLLRAVRAGLSTPNAAAMLLWSDGQHTVEGTGRNELLEVAAQARDARIPVLAIGVGDPTRIPNLKVVDLYATSEVWKNDPFEVQAVLRLQNVATESVQVELLEQKVDDSAAANSDFEVIQQKDIDIPTGVGHVQVSFQHAVEDKGTYAYTIRAAPVEDELKTDDNRPSAPVQIRVLSDIRVLLVTGQASWEYQLARRLLQREKSVTLSCWMQHIAPDRPQDGNKVIDQLPASAEELRQYDVVLLFDPDPAGFAPQWIEMLKDLVGSEAHGLFFQAGSHYSTRVLSDRETRRLGDLLPVEFGDLERLELETLDEDYSRPWKLDVVARNVDQPIMRFFPSAEQSLRKWQAMPEIYWSFPATGAKPAGRVLIQRDEQNRAVADEGRPLLVSGMYGAGRTVYMGFNGTWRWRRTPNDAQFYRRFWLQVIRYLVEGRSAASGGRGIVQTDRVNYALGDRITVYARRLKDEGYHLLEEAEIPATLQPADTDPQTVTLKLNPDQPGSYNATITARHTGLHKLTVGDEVAEGTEPLPSVSFRVDLPQLETKEVWLNKPLLSEIAESSGGKYYELDELDALIEDLPSSKHEIRVRGEPIPLWDNSRILLLLVGLLCGEWALRKAYRLI